MKYIAIPETFTQPDGEPLVIEDPDTKKVRAARAEARGHKDTLFAVPTVEATFIQALSSFTNHLPYKLNKDSKTSEYPLDFDDEGHRADILRACRNMEGYVLALERAPHEWIVQKLKEEGPTALGATCRILYEVLSAATEREA